MSHRPAASSASFAALVVLIATIPRAVHAQEARARESVARITISAGLEPGAGGGQGTFLGADVALSPGWSIGYSATARFDYSYTPSVASTSNGALIRGAIVGYRPTRWINVYAGPAVALTTLRLTLLQEGGDIAPRHDRRRVTGALAGASLRFYDRPYRFYLLRANWTWLPNQQLTARSDWNLGVGLGLAF